MESTISPLLSAGPDLDNVQWVSCDEQAAKRDLRELAKQFCRPAFLEIIRIAKVSPDLRLRLQACEYICDRAWGKAAQSVELSGMVDIRQTIDAPPRETREEWIARKRKEVSEMASVPASPVVEANGHANGHGMTK